MIPLLISLLIIIAICAVLFYVVDLLILANPFNRIAKAIIVLIGLLVFLQRTGYGGIS